LTGRRSAPRFRRWRKAQWRQALRYRRGPTEPSIGVHYLVHHL
jgi:hypothetical protein